MARIYAEISPELKNWIAQQPLFFLASAPLQHDGHINLSPRGLDSLRVIGGSEVIVLDMTGSGNETAAHLHENGRLTIMLCAFEGDPSIIRLFGKGSIIRPGDEQWQAFRSHFTTDNPGVRQIFHLQLDRVQSSCGFGVPLMDFVEQRDLLPAWAKKRGAKGIQEYQIKNNAQSIDGLPAPGLAPEFNYPTD